MRIKCSMAYNCKSFRALGILFILPFSLFAADIPGKQNRNDTLPVLLHTLGLDETATDSQIVISIKNELLSEKDQRAKLSLIGEVAKFRKLHEATRAAIILAELKKECTDTEKDTAEPDESPNPYLPENIKREYMFMLPKIGPAIAPFIKTQLQRERGEFRQRIAVVLGLMRDTSVFKTLVHATANAQSGWIRALSARALRMYNNRAAVPVLKKALDDGFYVCEKEDVNPPKEYEYYLISYPVRQEAYYSLLELGVKVRQKGTGPKDYHRYIAEE